MKKILYLGWIGFNNLGDELMVTMFQQLSLKYLNPNQYVIIPSVPGVDIQNLSSYDTVVMGGGSLLIPGYLDILYKAVEHQKQVIIWGSGHDRLDRFHIDATGSIQSDLSQENLDNRKSVATVIKNSLYCGVRGPLTFQYLQQVGAPMQNVNVSGDPGLLLTPDSSSFVQQTNKERWIGINWGTAYNRIYGQKELEVEDHLARTAKKLIKDGYKLHLFVVWGPDRAPCKRLYEKIGEPDKTVLDLELHDPAKLLNLIRHFMVTINFKLHANVVSAVANTPFVCLGYRFKSFDFGHSLGLGKYVVPTDSDTLTEDILKLVSDAQESHHEIIEKIRFCTQSVRRDLERPFAQKLF
ncbi:polysaccharide pyruvyl transferase family protein (plasmid) [Alicyclobacillus fastidiosus]|uniref:Polysaccharide pyruvyl transferase family protein n=1 Tax=Alicyclobacillus fastidiosus TaxID=392011 RepID=A0ABY6ZS35_9BACL|nr:polysaccharide pyruvyl transferase family protein [Alicyclobacillus fastidiosus]WAH44961.1 polysaccharide pyruvyl transferase family protein [Alicyclobacillus fastidiosus]GMA66228.1 hypothetical protein GCM10025859_66700 [Alicyclobacillus fastidiosus]GMA66261.1 hypothetical protein GCM10025859_67030 [Alicyclobacillus fastidiosus]